MFFSKYKKKLYINNSVNAATSINKYKNKNKNKVKNPFGIIYYKYNKKNTTLLIVLKKTKT